MTSEEVLVLAKNYTNTVALGAGAVPIPGTPGRDGEPGRDGVDGLPGRDGTNGINGQDGVGVPIGGTTGQVLSKASNEDFDTRWVTPTGGTWIDGKPIYRRVISTTINIMGYASYPPEMAQIEQIYDLETLISARGMFYIDNSVWGGGSGNYAIPAYIGWGNPSGSVDVNVGIKEDGGAIYLTFTGNYHSGEADVTVIAEYTKE